MEICDICGGEYNKTSNNQKYCKECGKNPDRTRAKLRRAYYVNKINAGDFDKPKERECRECGKSFMTITGRYCCSDFCQESYLIRTRTCPVCGIQLIKCGIETTGTRCCSDECRQKQRLQRATTSNNYKACEQCGKMFISKSISNAFCSRDCYNLSVKLAAKTRAATSNKYPVQTHKACSYCGQKFELKKGKRYQMYCTEDCRKKKYAEEKERKKREKLDVKNSKGDVHLCTTCRTSQLDCERFTSNFSSYPKDSKMKQVGKDFILFDCPKYKG